ncbi:alkaline phosphatase [Candidatus Latescibacterota bacterium]
MIAKLFIILISLTLYVTPAWSFFNSIFGSSKNVILIIPDGCSNTMWASIRAMTVGSGGILNIDRLPVQSRCSNYSADSMITDSAASATAYMCGIKTRNGILGMTAETSRGDSLSGKPAQSILEMAETAGFSTGVVTTTSIQHATPAVTYTHRAERDWYELIAHDLVGSGIEVIMGGGRHYMIPSGTSGEEHARSKRSDKRNIIEELRREGYAYVHDKVGFESIDPRETDKLLGIFNPDHMNYEFDRLNDVNGEPALWEMTDKALEILSQNKKGFFLLVEAGRIDHAAHDHDYQRYLWDGIACDKTVGVALEFARTHSNTLLVVVPDHGCGGPDLVGMYEIKGNDPTLVTRKQENSVSQRMSVDGFPAPGQGKFTALRWNEDTSHTGEDVILHAFGPSSEKLSGFVNNTDIFSVMADHLGFREKKKDIIDTIDF